MIKKILFIGAYGIENAGDDLPMLVMIENLKKNFPKNNFEFHALTRHLNEWEEKNYKINYHKNLEYENREEARGKWFRGLNYNDDREEFHEFLSLIKSMDVLVIGAGNFILDITIDIFKGPIPLMWWYIHLAKLYKKKVFLYGISSANLEDEYAKLLTQEILNKSDIITAREQNTKVYLSNFIDSSLVKVLPDPTLGVDIELNKISIYEKEKDFFDTDKKVIALGLRQINFIKDNDSFFDEIISFINNNKEYKYIFIPQSTYFEDDDRVMAYNLSKKIDKGIEFHIVEDRYTPYSLIKLYSLCEVTIAIRLHAAVFSCIGNTPVIAISYLPKVKAFMVDYGLKDYCLDIKACTYNTISQIFEKILLDDCLEDNLKKRNIILKNRVKEYSKLLVDLMKVDKNGK